jgi:hypothetical protein
MPRTKISEFSATPGDNTDIDGIDIAEGCAPSGINNAIRELMAQLKDMQTGASGDTFTLTTVNSTTVDTTNLEATNLKAKDGTAAGSIANSTGVVTLASSVLTTTDINGGTVDGTTIGATTPSTVVATQVDITAQGDLRLQDTTGGQYVALQAPGTIATSYTLTLPVDDGTSGQALITDGSGVLSWSTAASGDVYGPASATDNAIARFDGTTGKIIQNSAVTIADDGATVIAANSTSDGLRITQIGTGNALLVEDSANPDSTPVVIDNSGKLLVGNTTSVGGTFGNASTVQNMSFGGYAVGRFFNDASAPVMDFVKSRNGTIGSQTVVQSGDAVGEFYFSGSDGTAFIRAAQITASVDGTPGTNDMPGRLVFSTTADGASSPTERMRIDSTGRVGIGSSSLAGFGVRQSNQISGNSFSRAYLIDSTNAADVSNTFIGFGTALPTANAVSNLQHFSAGQGTLTGAVTNQFGFNVASSLTGATNNYGFYSNIASGTGRWNFYAAGTADNYFAGALGLGSVPIAGVVPLNIGYTLTGGTSVSNVRAIPTIASDVTSSATLFRTQPFTQAAAFTLSSLIHYNATQGTFGATSAVTNQYGFFADAGLTGATNNYGFLGNIASGTGRFNFYAAGTAANVFVGTTSIGGIVGSESLRVTPVASAVNYWETIGAATGGSIGLYARGSDANVGMIFVGKGTGQTFFNNNGANQFAIGATASAVNYLQVQGNAAGSAPFMSAQGSDTNINMYLSSKGTGSHVFASGGGTQFVITNTASAVNNLFATGSATGAGVLLAASGSDTNIDIRLLAKGTGVLAFGTYTAGIIAQAGYITIKDAGGTTRRLLVG